VYMIQCSSLFTSSYALQPSLLAGRTAAMSNPAFEFDHIHIISQSPQDSANWYVQMFGADIVADTVARGAPQICLELGGKTLIIRGQRPGESPTAAREIQPYANYSSHNAWGTDHFGFIYHGDLRAFYDELHAKGVRFPVALKKGVGGRLLCYVSAPDGVSIELMQG
jgi:catechol 2,3-dioxygenase-like lactoylglutathione lyase family enzyme